MFISKFHVVQAYTILAENFPTLVEKKIISPDENDDELADAEDPANVGSDFGFTLK